jgi:hypothetical protein
MAAAAEMEMLVASAEQTEVVVARQTVVQAAVAVRVVQVMFLRVVQELHQVFLEIQFIMAPAAPATMVVLVQRQVAQQHKVLTQLLIVAAVVHTEKPVGLA